MGHFRADTARIAAFRWEHWRHVRVDVMTALLKNQEWLQVMQTSLRFISPRLFICVNRGFSPRRRALVRFPHVLALRH